MRLERRAFRRMFRTWVAAVLVEMKSSWAICSSEVLPETMVARTWDSRSVNRH